MSDNNDNIRAWYVIQTYSGMEYAAKRNLDQRIESMNMEEFIFKVLIPEKTHYEKKKNGDMKAVTEKLFPGYIFIDMIVTDESWFIVRNTPMVTGILGSSGGSAKPVPLTDDEIIPILKECGITIEIQIDFKVGDTVEIKSGNFAGQTAIVEKIDMDNQIATVLIDFFGRQTPTEVRFDEIK